MACVCSKIGTRDFRTRSKSAKVAQHTLLGVMVSNKCNSNMWTNQETLTAVCTRAVCMRHHGELSNCNCSKPDKRWLIYIYWEHLREHSACFIEHSFMYDYSRFPCKLNGESLFFFTFSFYLVFFCQTFTFSVSPVWQSMTFHLSVPDGTVTNTELPPSRAANRIMQWAWLIKLPPSGTASRTTECAWLISLTYAGATLC